MILIHDIHIGLSRDFSRQETHHFFCGALGGSGPGKEGRNMDHFCVRLESFEEQAIREHLVHHGVSGSKLETRYGAEGQGPSIYIQDPEGVVDVYG